MTLVFAVMYLYNFFHCFCPFLFLCVCTLYKSGIDKSTDWPTIPACPSLLCFFFFFLNWSNTQGANSSKILCLTFVYVLLYM